MQPKPVDTTEEEAKRKAEANKYVDKITGRLNPYQSSPDFGTMLMATGGTVNTNSSSIASGGIQDLYGTNDQTTGTQNLSKEGYGIGRLNSLAAEGSRAKAADTFYAAGGPIAFAEGGSSDIKIPGYDGNALNVNDFSSLNLGGGNYGISGLPEGVQNLTRSLRMAGEMDTINPSARIFSRMMSGLLSGDPGMLGMIQGKGAPSSLVSGLAKGGYLDGAGDGMSDSIPATIEGKQAARLADGEFVIPADVVSHLGNGSSKAGSKRLYAMLDKVRHARTGNKKQGKEIKAEKYLPA
jgi:hypothetical protein